MELGIFFLERDPEGQGIDDLHSRQIITAEVQVDRVGALIGLLIVKDARGLPAFFADAADLAV